MDSIVGGIKSFFTAATQPQIVSSILNRTLYGGQQVVPSTMLQPGTILAPKSAFPTEYVLLGGGLLALLLISRKKGKK
jgi:hypothetical protein